MLHGVFKHCAYNVLVQWTTTLLYIGPTATAIKLRLLILLLDLVGAVRQGREGVRGKWGV